MRSRIGRGSRYIVRRGLLQEVIMSGVELLEKGSQPGGWSGKASVVVDLWKREVVVALNKDSSRGAVGQEVNRGY